MTELAGLTLPGSGPYVHFTHRFFGSCTWTCCWAAANSRMLVPWVIGHHLRRWGYFHASSFVLGGGSDDPGTLMSSGGLSQSQIQQHCTGCRADKRHRRQKDTGSWNREAPGLCEGDSRTSTAGGMERKRHPLKKQIAGRNECIDCN